MSETVTKYDQLLAPASDALTSPCLTGPITEYDWAEGIALMTIFSMFFIELIAARYEIFGEQGHDLEASDPASDLIKQQEKLGSKNRLNSSEHPNFLPVDILPAFSMATSHSRTIVACP